MASSFAVFEDAKRVKSMHIIIIHDETTIYKPH